MLDTDPSVDPIDPPDDTNPTPTENPDPSAGDLAMIDPPDDTKKTA